MMARTGAVLFCVAVCSATLGAATAMAAECAQQVVFLPEAALAAVAVETESSRQGWLGVSIADVTDELRKKEGLADGVAGVLVLGVYGGSPAEKATIKEGDVITAAAGAKIESVAQLVDLIASSAPGKEVTIAVLRDGNPMTIKVTLAERDTTKRASIENLAELEALKGLEALQDLKIDLNLPWLELGLAGAYGHGRLGVYIDDLSEGLAEHFGVPGGKGVLVEDIVEGSPAEKGGIAAGDVVLKVGDRSVSDTNELKEAISGIEAGKETPIVVWRGGKQQTLRVTIEESEHALAKKAHMRALQGGDGTEVRKIVIEESEAASDLRQTIDELKAEIQELKKEIQALEKEAESE
jgi:S1-C subfamily serine protease